MENKKGFTLIELLVVVLIIGILAGIALPQYKMAVTKAKVASILPLMRSWKDALMVYKLQHGDYVDENGAYPQGDVLGVNWPSDWEEGDGDCGDSLECFSDYWSSCFANEEQDGTVACVHDVTDDTLFSIQMYQSDYTNENFRDKITCYADGDEAHKVCKALGGKLPEGLSDTYILY